MASNDSMFGGLGFDCFDLRFADDWRLNLGFTEDVIVHVLAAFE